MHFLFCWNWLLLKGFYINVVYMYIELCAKVWTYLMLLFSYLCFFFSLFFIYFLICLMKVVYCSSSHYTANLVWCRFCSGQETWTINCEQSNISFMQITCHLKTFHRERFVEIDSHFKINIYNFCLSLLWTCINYKLNN